MSILLNNTKNYDVNRLPSLDTWTGSGISLTNNGILIAAAGEATTSLSYSGLHSSSYRRLRIVLAGTLPIDSNLSNTNALEVILKYRYLQNATDSSGQEVSHYCYLHQSVVITPLNSNLENGLWICEKVLAFPELDATDFEVTIKNRTSAAIEIYACSLKQSADTQPSQLADVIEFSTALESVDAYTDGCLIKYRGDSEPLQIQYQQDGQGNFNGVLVNDSLFIPFTRHNEPL